MTKPPTKPLDETIKPPGQKSEENGGNISGLNSPMLDTETGKPTQKAVSSFKQAHAISKRDYDRANSNGGRLKTAATVMDKYNGSAPFKNDDLRKLGQTWRNNYSTNFLGSIIDRAKPQLTDPLKQTDSVTFSALPAERKEAANKTRKFRERTTKLIRSWPAWVDFIDGNSQETYLHGQAAPGWIDDDWKPKCFSTDEVFLPEGSGQHASQIQMVTYKQPILLHDFLKKIEDKEIAEDAGYDFGGCIKAANEAGGLASTNDGDQAQSAVHLQDKIREGSSLGNADAENKVLWVYHLLVREYTGGVALWTTACKGGHPIRYVENLHETMEDATTLFTLQTGNRKFYGSKGAGRLLANLHIAIERLRNLANDQVYLSGLPIIVADEKEMNRIQPTVRHPFIILPKGCTVATEAIQFDWTAYEGMEKNLVSTAESIAGAFIPPKIDNGGSPSTKIEAAQKAARELAIRNGILGRHFGHYADLVSAMQRKIYKAENIREAIRLFQENQKKQAKGLRVLANKLVRILKEAFNGTDNTVEERSESKIADNDAVQTIVDLLGDGLTPEDIVELSLVPAGNKVEEQPEAQDDKTVQFIEAKLQTQSPYFDQKKMSELEARIALGDDRAEQILLASAEDPTIEAVNVREQLMEFREMMDGVDMPVAGTDVHRIHRKVLGPKATPIMDALEHAPTPELFKAGQLMFNHLGTHLEMDKETEPAIKQQEMQGLEQWRALLASAEKTLAKQQEEAAKAGITGGPNAVPTPMGGQPQEPPPPAPELVLEANRLQAETTLRAAEIELGHRKVDLEERKATNSDYFQTAKFATETMGEIARQAHEAERTGMEAAERSLQENQPDGSPKKPA